MLHNRRKRSEVPGKCHFLVVVCRLCLLSLSRWKRASSTYDDGTEKIRNFSTLSSFRFGRHSLSSIAAVWKGHVVRSDQSECGAMELSFYRADRSERRALSLEKITDTFYEISLNAAHRNPFFLLVHNKFLWVNTWWDPAPFDALNLFKVLLHSAIISHS